MTGTHEHKIEHDWLSDHFRCTECGETWRKQADWEEIDHGEAKALRKQLQQMALQVLSDQGQWFQLDDVLEIEINRDRANERRHKGEPDELYWRGHGDGIQFVRANYSGGQFPYPRNDSDDDDPESSAGRPEATDQVGQGSCYRCGAYPGALERCNVVGHEWEEPVAGPEATDGG